jgi:hypothetical protein
LQSGDFDHSTFSGKEGKDNVPPAVYAGTLLDVIWRNRDSATPTAQTQPASYPVNIPLNLLLGLFAVDKLLPPQLVHGLEIQIGWANAFTVLAQNINPYADLITPYINPSIWAQNIYGADANPGYQVSEMYISLDTYSLEQNVVSLVASQASSQVGIPLKFQTYTQVVQQRASNAAQTLTLPIEQSFTSASMFITTARLRVSGLDRGVYLDSMVPYLTNQPWIAGGSFALRFNGVSYPHDAVDTREDAYHHWLSAFGKNRLYMDVRGPLPGEFFFNMGTTFAVDLNRAPYSFKIAGSAVSTESNRLRSGQRIDGTNPLTLQLSLGAVPAAALAPFTTEDYFAGYPNQFRSVMAWVEHERVLLISASGNRVLV